MEKLFKLVCANFALKSKRPLSCHDKLENRVDDANIMFTGMYLNSITDRKKGIVDLARFLKLSIDDIHKFNFEYDRNNGKRFSIKKGLIRNGLKLLS